MATDKQSVNEAAAKAGGARSATARAKLTCAGVWKVFGKGAEAFLAQRDKPPGPAELIHAGLIGAVRDASLEVAAGEIFVIMGLSGSGKSTLVRCLSRLIEPTAGAIYFEDQDLLKTSETRWAWCFSTSPCCPISPCSATWPFRSRFRASTVSAASAAPSR
jgi:hypothetical protein